MQEIFDKPLGEIAAALRDGTISSSDLAEAAIARHESIGDSLNAYKTWSPEFARAQAQAADAVFASGADLGPLHGIPTSVKDLYGVKGLPTFAGTARRLPVKWEREGPVIAAVRRQLGVIMGKTHTVELAFGGIGVNNSWGTPRNPWDAQTHRVPGGSSSGAGVSLCEGSALVALGSDTAGSVRIPASMTGNVGLKTSFGRWSLDGIVPLSPTLDTAGVLARSVADVVYAFAALDPAWDNAASLTAHLSGLEATDLRIGVGDSSMWENCDDEIAQIVKSSLDELAVKGARRQNTALPEAEDALELLRIGSIVSAECAAFLSKELPQWMDAIDPIIAARIADGGEVPAREFVLRHGRIRKLAAAAADRFDKVDVIASPTIPITPPKLSEVSTLEDYRPRNMQCLSNTCVANFLGLCAITMPVGLDSAGMPVGLQLLAPRGREEQLLALALAAEKVLGVPRARIGTPPMCR